MCLNYNKKLTDDLKAKFKDNSEKTIICYKTFKSNKDKLFSPIYTREYLIANAVDGFLTISSNREQKKLDKGEKTEGVVGRGIHVFLDERSAKRYAGSDEIVVPVICKKADLVAVGLASIQLVSAVFMQVKIDIKKIPEPIKCRRFVR